MPVYSAVQGNASNAALATPAITSDGFTTLRSSRFNTLYHSSFGARTESEVVFIGAGLKAITAKHVSILEVGLGTGLNAALAAEYANTNGISISYQAIELYPLQAFEYDTLNYKELLSPYASKCWKTLCNAPWEEEIRITDSFTITKIHANFVEWTPNHRYHVVFFDAFAPNDQPEMWTHEMFSKLHSAMHPGGVLSTYCVKGLVKNALTLAGFSIERLPGPPGKRHILRAWQ
jgi:tRNA U34 5-methylaminomethyl-2-thiouridine-forming methyltransferase MnmC